MCGRFAFFGNNQASLESLGVVSDPPLIESYNIAPTQDVIVIRTWPETGQLEYGMLRWGLLPFWSKTNNTKFPMINARADGIEKKPSFRGPFKYPRCIIPASGFYEWQTRAGSKQPYFVRPKGGGVFLLDGIWDHWQKILIVNILWKHLNLALAYNLGKSHLNIRQISTGYGKLIGRVVVNTKNQARSAMIRR